MNKISGVYKITNTVTGDFYIGSSKDVETRWVKHKSPSRWKEVNKKAHKKYNNQLCVYNGETLTLDALRTRFQRAGIPHPSLEAKKYLEKQ